MKRYDFNNNIWIVPCLPTIPTKVAPLPDCDKHIFNKTISDLSATNIFGDCCQLLSDRGSLDWQFLFENIQDIPSPYAKNQNYSFDKIDQSKWTKIVVPSGIVMQGFDIKNNVEYYYKRTITLPKYCPDNKVMLRFEGVYSNARVWIDNQYIKTHVGGFTTWDCDITQFANKSAVVITVGVADIEGCNIGIWNTNGKKVSNSAWGSYYAHHNIGGIIRDVTMFVLPKTHIERTHINTKILSQKNAVISIAMQVASFARSISNADGLQNAADNISNGTNCVADLQKIGNSVDKNLRIVATLLYNGIVVTTNTVAVDKEFLSSNALTIDTTSLFPTRKWKNSHAQSFQNDSKYAKCFFAPSTLDCDNNLRYSFEFELNVDAPHLWDAEHPNLYSLKIQLFGDDNLIQENNHIVGIREICFGGAKESDKNKIYINGKQIKLRGVCRHDVSHLYGRSLTKEDIYNEIATYKACNINHIRTSHYPASEYMLEVCDRLGIYVEQENPACFKGANNFGIYNPPQDFVNSFAEMIESSRNHASIIIWSLGNESGFEKTYAFRKEYEYAKVVDKTRPIIFSYPHTVHSKPTPYDIYSYHYKDVSSNLGGSLMPVLHDEFAHVACYNIDNLSLDNSARDFWGESIKRGWDKIFGSDGALGCAIWGAIDDVFYLPNGVSQRHQHHSKGKCSGYGEWGCIFDAYKRQKPEAYLTKKAFSPILLDEEKSVIENGILKLFVQNRFDHANLNEIKMICRDENSNEFFCSNITSDIAPHNSGKIVVDCKNISCANISFSFAENVVDEYIINAPCKAQQPTCDTLIPTSISILENKICIFASDKLIANNLLLLGKSAKLRHVKQKDNKTTAIATLNGQLQFKLQLTLQDGKIYCSMTPKNLSAKLSLQNNISLSFDLSTSCNSVTWSKKSLYSAYPDSHIGRPNGTAILARKDCDISPDKYGVKPSWSFEEDMQNYFLYAEIANGKMLVTNDFLTKRNNIHNYCVNLDNGFCVNVAALSDDLNAYVAPNKSNNGTCQLLISKGQYYPDIKWGNYLGKKRNFFKEKIEFILSISNCENTNK